MSPMTFSSSFLEMKLSPSRSMILNAYSIFWTESSFSWFIAAIMNSIIIYFRLIHIYLPVKSTFPDPFISIYFIILSTSWMAISLFCMILLYPIMSSSLCNIPIKQYWCYECKTIAIGIEWLKGLLEIFILLLGNDLGCNESQDGLFEFTSCLV